MPMRFGIRVGRKISYDTFHLLSRSVCVLEDTFMDNSARQFTCSRSFSNATCNDELSLNDGVEYRKWKNGGGLFHMSASINNTAIIEIGAVIHAGSKLEDGVFVGSGAVIGPQVSISNSSKIWYNAVLSNCDIGASCIIHHGVCIGQDGFGFLADKDGCIVKKPQMLRVRIGNNVEVGANTCIDRGSWRDTTIGDHCKIDNLVQIGHNVIIGKGCILCGQVGIAGSATIGDYVTMGGRAMVRDHVSIVSKVRLAANSGVTKDILISGDYGGFPAIPINKWRRHAAQLQKLFAKSNSE